MRFIKVFISILRINFIARLQFRAAAWARLSTFMFVGFIEMIVILVFYTYGNNGPSRAGMTMEQAISYIWLVQIVVHISPQFGRDNEVWQKIRSGEIGIELCRPVDLYFHFYARAVVSRIAPFLIQLVPVTVFAILLPAPYGLRPPASIYAFLAAGMALAAALMLSCACLCATYPILMNINLGEGPVNIILMSIGILSGTYLPLQLWPQWMQGFLYWQPFAGIVDMPLRLYVVTMTPHELWRVLSLQLSWTAVIITFGWLWLQKRLRHLVIQGG